MIGPGSRREQWLAFGIRRHRGVDERRQGAQRNNPSPRERERTSDDKNVAPDAIDDRQTRTRLAAVGVESEYDTRLSV